MNLTEKYILLLSRPDSIESGLKRDVPTLRPNQQVHFIHKVDFKYTLGFEAEIASSKEFITKISKTKNTDPKLAREKAYEDWQRIHFPSEEKEDWTREILHELLRTSNDRQATLKKFNIEPKFGWVEINPKPQRENYSNDVDYEVDLDNWNFKNKANFYADEEKTKTLSLRKCSLDEINLYFKNNKKFVQYVLKTLKNKIDYTFEMFYAQNWSNYIAQQPTDYPTKFSSIWQRFSSLGEIDDKNMNRTLVEYIAKSFAEFSHEETVEAEVSNKNYKVNSVCLDSSINPYGAELVSRVLPSVNEGWKWCEKVFDYIDSHNEDLYTNDSTGFHINIGTWPESERNNVDLLKLLLLLKDRKLINIFNRLGNEYVLPAAKALNRALKETEEVNQESLKSDKASILKLINEINNLLRRNANHYDVASFTKFSEKGFIEFRAAGGENYHKKRSSIKNTLVTCLQACVAASDPEMFKERYLQLLYKMITRHFNPPDKNQDIDNFVLEEFKPALARLKNALIRSGLNIQFVNRLINDLIATIIELHYPGQSKYFTEYHAKREIIRSVISAVNERFYEINDNKNIVFPTYLITAYKNIILLINNKYKLKFTKTLIKKTYADGSYRVVKSFFDKEPYYLYYLCIGGSDNLKNIMPYTKMTIAELRAKRKNPSTKKTIYKIWTNDTSNGHND